MDYIKGAFQKVKQDIGSLEGETRTLKKNFTEIKEMIQEIKAFLRIPAK